MHKLCESIENASKYGIQKKWVNTQQVLLWELKYDSENTTTTIIYLLFTIHRKLETNLHVY
jgi:hypothetical protein